MLRRTQLLLLTCAFALLAANPVIEQAQKLIAAKKYDEGIAKLETAYKAKPAPDLKKALADGNLAKADAFMNDESQPPRIRYTTALRAYREVLKYEPENKKAKSNVATIEGIYKSMGRPIPQ